MVYTCFMCEAKRTDAYDGWLGKSRQLRVAMAAQTQAQMKVSRYDSADYLKTEENINNCLEAIFEEPMDRQMLIHTLGVVARARGMMKLAKETGIT